MDERRGLSRRGLFGALSRGARELASSLQQGARDGAPGAAGDAPPPRAANLPRVLRHPATCADARADGFGAWRTDRMLETLRPGTDLCLRGDDLPEPVIVVRVNAVHVTACSGECSADGSELVWDADGDRLRCPSCGTRWRLDGEPTSGPAQTLLARFDVTAEPDGLRVTKPEETS